MSFNNDNTIDTVEIPSETMHNLSSFTISLWVNLQILSDNSCFFSIANSGTQNEVLLCNSFMDLKYGETPTARTTLSSKITTADKWTHILLSRDAENATLKYYLDGILKKTVTGTSTNTLNAEGIFLGND